MFALLIEFDRVAIVAWCALLICLALFLRVAVVSLGFYRSSASSSAPPPSSSCFVSSSPSCFSCSLVPFRVDACLVAISFAVLLVLVSLWSCVALVLEFASLDESLCAPSDNPNFFCDPFMVVVGKHFTFLLIVV